MTDFVGPIHDFPYEKEEEYLQSYLHDIQSNTGDGFKRVLVSPLRYAGGKSKAVGLILDNLPKLREKKWCLPSSEAVRLNCVCLKPWVLKWLGMTYLACLQTFGTCSSIRRPRLSRRSRNLKSMQMSSQKIDTSCSRIGTKSSRIR